MLRNGIFRIGLAFILCSLLVFSGCNATLATATLSEVTMAKKVNDNTMEPVDKGDVFSTDAPSIYCTVKLANAPSGTKVKAEWVATDVTGQDKDRLIESKTIETDGTRYLAFSLTKDTLAWSEGIYTINLFINDIQVEKTSFRVVSNSSGAAGTPTAEASVATPPAAVTSTPASSASVALLSEVTMAKSVKEDTQEPNIKGDVFQPNADTIYCTVKLNNAPPNTQVKAEWIATDVSGVAKNLSIESNTLTVEGTRYLGFALDRKTEVWPVGQYAVNLFVNDQPVATAQFTVAE